MKLTRGSKVLLGFGVAGIGMFALSMFGMRYDYFENLSVLFFYLSILCILIAFIGGIVKSLSRKPNVITLKDPSTEKTKTFDANHTSYSLKLHFLGIPFFLNKLYIEGCTFFLTWILYFYFDYHFGSDSTYTNIWLGVYFGLVLISVRYGNKIIIKRYQQRGWILIPSEEQGNA